MIVFDPCPMAIASLSCALTPAAFAVVFRVLSHHATTHRPDWASGAAASAHLARRPMSWESDTLYDELRFLFSKLFFYVGLLGRNRYGSV